MELGRQIGLATGAAAMPGPEAVRAGFTGGATGPFVSPTGPSPEGQMWVQMDSEHVPDSYMHHAYKFAKTYSSGLKQNVEDYWNRMGRPEQFDPHQAHDFFRQLMREGRADEVNAVHQHLTGKTIYEDNNLVLQ